MKTANERLPAVLRHSLAVALTATGLRGREALSELFEFEVDFVASAADAGRTDFGELIGKPLTVQFPPAGESRFFAGVVRQLRREYGDARFIAYRAWLVPPVWTLACNRRSRAFQDLTVVQILQIVFTGFQVDYQLTDAYLPHHYVVQYEESDFQFARRLMEEEGIYFCFDHSANGCTLVIADDSRRQAENTAAIRGMLRAAPANDGIASITDWSLAQDLVPAVFAVNEHSMFAPTNSLAASATAASPVLAGTQSYSFLMPNEISRMEWAPGYAHRFDLTSTKSGFSLVYAQNQREAALRMERSRSAAVTVTGTSDCVGLQSGKPLQLAGVPLDDGLYLLTAVEHEYRAANPAADHQQGTHYRNCFRGMPASERFRPQALTPKPAAKGIDTATVVGTDQVSTDEYGRVKVQFHWARASGAAGNSCWLRVLARSAGGDFGAASIPRVGHEVLIGYAQGDIDRPVVVGSLYNSDNLTPCRLPDFRYRSGMVTQSIDSDSAFTGTAFDDTPGAELHLSQTPGSSYQTSNGNHGVNVGNQFSVNVGSWHRQTVGGIPFLSNVPHLVSGGSAKGSGAGGADSSILPSSSTMESLGYTHSWTLFGVAEEGALGCSMHVGMPALKDMVYAPSKLSKLFGYSKYVVGADTNIVYADTYRGLHGTAYKARGNLANLSEIVAKATKATQLTTAAIAMANTTLTILQYFKNEIPVVKTADKSHTLAGVSISISQAIYFLVSVIPGLIHGINTTIMQAFVDGKTLQQLLDDAKTKAAEFEARAAQQVRSAMTSALSIEETGAEVIEAKIKALAQEANQLVINSAEALQKDVDQTAILAKQAISDAQQLKDAVSAMGNPTAGYSNTLANLSERSEKSSTELTDVLNAIDKELTSHSQQVTGVLKCASDGGDVAVSSPTGKVAIVGQTRVELSANGPTIQLSSEPGSNGTGTIRIEGGQGPVMLGTGVISSEALSGSMQAIVLQSSAAGNKVGSIDIVQRSSANATSGGELHIGNASVLKNYDLYLGARRQTVSTSVISAGFGIFASYKEIFIGYQSDQGTRKGLTISNPDANNGKCTISLQSDEVKVLDYQNAGIASVTNGGVGLVSKAGQSLAVVGNNGIIGSAKYGNIVTSASSGKVEKVGTEVAHS